MAIEPSIDIRSAPLDAPWIVHTIARSPELHVEGRGEPVKSLCATQPDRAVPCKDRGVEHGQAVGRLRDAKCPWTANRQDVVAHQHHGTVRCFLNIRAHAGTLEWRRAPTVVAAIVNVCVSGAHPYASEPVAQDLHGSGPGPAGHGMLRHR